MSIPFWKKIVSFIYPIQLERVQSKFQVLEVNLQYGNVVLDSETANYSFGALHLAFQDAIEYIDFPSCSSDQVLILGFGAGSIAHILKNDYNFQGSIVGVELDSKVIELAKKYLDRAQFASTEIEEIDALEFVKQSERKFNALFIDVFVEQEVPENFKQASFFKSCNDLLNEKGVILMNSMVNQTNSAIEEAFTSALNDHGSTEAFEVNEGENRMLYFKKK